MSYSVHDLQQVNFSADVHNLVFDYSGINLNPSTTGLSVTGIDPYGRALPVTEIVLMNASANPIMLKHNDSGSTAGNRFFFSDNSNHTLGAYSMVWALYKEDVAGRVGWWVEIP